MNENVLFRVIAIDETIAALYIEPLYGSRYFFSCKIREKNIQNIIKSFQICVERLFLDAIDISVFHSIGESEAFQINKKLNQKCW